MSWLFSSVQSNDSDSSHPYQPQSPVPSPEQSPSPSPRRRDLSVIRHSIGRQLRGVATFLAPPPSAAAETTSPADSLADGSPDSVSSQVLLGIRNDLAEIGGSFKTGLSLLSSNKAVTEISRFASCLLQSQDEDSEERVPGDDDVGGDAPGIDGEVLAFAKEISALPACWTDFPLALDNDFNMSDAQREHALAIEHLVPRLGVLRVKLHGYISDEQFWMIYFILLLPRLNEHDFELLSTPKVAKARDLLLQKLQNRRYGKSEVDNLEKSEVLDTPQDARETQGENSPSRAKVDPARVAKEVDTVVATEQWFKDIDEGNTSLAPLRTLAHEDDASFSDLEDDDSDRPGRSPSLGPIQETGSASPCGSSDWVQLKSESRGPSDWVQLKNESGSLQKAGRAISRGRESESDGSNGWLTVDDYD